METVQESAGAGKKVLKGPKACSTCARAKSRCIPGPARQEKCERCHRLRKPCSSQTPAPPRKRKDPKPTRVSELERRLEDLTARMESVQRAGQAAVPSPPESDHYVPHSTYPPLAPDDPAHPRTISGTPAPIPTFGPDSPFGHLFPARSIFDGPPQHEHPATSNRQLLPATNSTSPPTPAGPTPTQPTTAGSTDSSPGQLSSPNPQQQQSSPLWPDGDEAEALLGVYRKHMAHLFPFAVVPPHLSSAQMREQRPLFWKAIMMEAHLFDGPRQVALGNELLREISEAAFMKPQKNLDLLQGLQMLIAWYHYNLNNFQMVNLLFLARSITTSLGSAELKGPPNQAGYDSESLEQMRAFAGTYYLVTITFTTNKRPDALMNTSYLTTCCRALHGQMEYPTDELVVHLVRAQQLSQSVSQGFARRKAGYVESQMSQAAFIQGLQDRIQGFAAALPPHIRTNPSLMGHLHVAEILVYENRLEELSHCAVPCRPGEQGPTASSPESVNETTPEHVKMLWACACVVRTFLTNRFSGEIGDYPRFVRLSSFDLTYVFLTMLKMVTLQVPGWDLARVRDELHFDEFVTRLVKHMEHTSARRKKKSKEGVPSSQSSNHETTGPENEAGDLFTKLAGKIRFVKDHLHANGFDGAYATSQVARVCDPAPMTLADATQDLLQDLGGGLWQDLTTSTSEWDLLFVDEAVDWAAVFSDYSMAESGYVA